ncbi:hypothetical protein AAFF_G00031220 [Aldrovandia affinis]|uniref:Myb/SANT-like DNA-binding domain-containing protein n=1 Tax=Aldrovandia affinis TaxID=143900 RepID=A0AAD7S467_9TELE|nr:hypothetical protein AAFF_G00031220 [Aldrovandia affinis]
MSMPGLEPRARLRKPKFTPDQIRVLIERVVAHGRQLYGERMSPVSVRKRIWQEVTHAINGISNTERSVIEVQKRWQDERRRIRHRAQDLWRALEETGVPMGRLTPLEEAVMSTFDELGAGRGSEGTAPVQATLAHQHKMAVSPAEDPPLSQQPTPTRTPTPTASLVCLSDIKQEPGETRSPVGGGSRPQEWKFEWTVEDMPVASLPTNPAPPAPDPPQAPPPQAPPDTTALHTSSANQPRGRVRSPHRAAQWRRVRTHQRWGALDRAGCAGLTACMRRLASGTAGLRDELQGLSHSVEELRGELGALVSAVSTIASVLQVCYGDRNAGHCSVTPMRHSGGEPASPNPPAPAASEA